MIEVKRSFAYTMPAKDTFHHSIKLALQKDGWTITHDPLTLEIGLRQIYIDLGAEKLIAAEKDNQRIAVEVKTFAGASSVTEFHLAVGQFLNYRSILRRQQPNRILYLAVSVGIYSTFLKEELPQISIEDYRISLIVFDPKTEEIARWIS
jgi:XisH protein